MAQPTGVYVTFSSAGLREDLENVIYDIPPTDRDWETSAASLA